VRVAIVGSDGLASRLATHAYERGDDVLGAGLAPVESWPPDVPFVVAATADELSAALAAHRPAVVVMLGPGRGERSEVSPAVIVQAVGAIERARVVYWGSAVVYGRSRGVQGRVLLEGAPLAAGGGAADALAADSAAQQLVEARRGEVHLFRAAEIVGAGQATLFAALGRLAVVPTPASHRYLQLLDPRDALEVLDRAMRGGHPGVYNVSADGILKVDEACRALGRSTVRLPRLLLPLVAYGARWTGKVESARELMQLTAGTPLVDNARLKTHFGFRPRFTTRQALAAARDEARAPAI